ncbi:MAG TPA: vanadium-dependent haloperoxidase [Planctomycetota bacterium]|nr:vanadium-dependent haloperoxidase [Planctomycetota bacterium]
MHRIAFFACLILIGCASHGRRPTGGGSGPGFDPETGWIIHQASNPSPNAAYRWMHIMQEASGRSVDRFGARPTIISREMHIVLTAMYDAWAAYDDKAVGTRLGGTLRRPPAERTSANKEKAIATAAYRALLYVYPEDAAWISGQMRAEGHDPNDATRDLATPQGVGNTAAAAVIEYRRHDGANQHGDESGSNGKPYSDYTFYEPRNPIDKIVDPDRWQQLPFDDGKGGKVYPNFLTAHWYRVKPFALDRSDQFRPPPPPKVGSEQLKKEVDECIVSNAGLSPEHKAIVEFMRDGPRSTGQSGHWLRFAADVSRRDRHTLDQDVKLYFTIANIVFDAFISCWEAKRYYDSSRPWTLIRYYYKGKTIDGYLGPCKGFGSIPAEQWHPYSPSTFVTPPFPGYTSGHATASGGASKMLELITGSDRYECMAIRTAGELTELGCSVGQMQAHDGVIDPKIKDDREVRLRLPTFSATAEMAALSRMLGGYHIATDNNVGLEFGRRIAIYSWPKYRAYFDGTAAPRD